MKVLIPIDGSDASEATLKWAVQTLDKKANEFVLLSVVADPMIAEYEVEDAKEMLQEAKTYLEGHGARVVKAGYIQADPIEGICQFAIDEHADQILLGSHGRSGLSKLLMGSVSEGVLEKAKVPVFIYRNVSRVPANA